MEIQKSSPCSWQPPEPRRSRRRRPYANAIDRTNDSPSSNQTHEATVISEGCSSSSSMISHIELPEDILRHIYSLLTMRDAACTACASQRFLHFWRCFPKLVFNPETLAVCRQPFFRGGDRGKYVFSKAQEVLENHSGIGVKTLKLHLSTCCKKDIHTSLLDGWLQAFVKPCSRCHYMDAKAMEEAESKTGRRFLQRQEDGSIALVFIQPRS